jgi:uncharacterized protein YbjT (DUF2867 family)
MLLAVVGATGNQGSSVINAVRESQRRIAVRAIVRDARTPKAAALAECCAELVEASLDDAESLRAAFEGADAAYCVTPPDGDTDHGRETERARNMAAAARRAKLAHVIWSTQEDTRDLLESAGSTIPVLGGRFRVPSYDAKGEADDAFRQCGVPTTFMRTSFYWESLFIPGLAPTVTADGSVLIRWPLGTSKLPGIAVADIGRCAVGLLARRSAYVGQTIGICGEQLTGVEIANLIGDAFGLDCRYEALEPEEFRRSGIASAAGIANMFQYKRDFERFHVRLRDAALSRSLNPSLKTFREWLQDAPTVTAFRGVVGGDDQRQAVASGRNPQPESQ